MSPTPLDPSQTMNGIDLCQMGDVLTSPIWTKLIPFIVCEELSGFGNIYAVDLRLLTLVSYSTTSLMASPVSSPALCTAAIAASTSATSTVPAKSLDATFAMVALIFQLSANVKSHYFF